jgi:chromosome segregation ATPase
MPRELNPELFESFRRELEAAESTGVQPTRDLVRPSSLSPNKMFEPEFEVCEEDWVAVIEQIRKLTKTVKDLEIAQQKQDTKTQEVLGAAKIRIERIGTGAQRLDEKSAMKFTEIAQKLASLTSKVTERKVSDRKIEDLLNRHNLTVQNFELRLQQMQKIINEQEMQLMNYKSALTEAKRELEQMRRR